MLIEFTVSNYKSFLDEAKFSLVAASLSDLKDNLISTDRLELLSSAVLYGSNSSGKTNLFDALYLMRDMVLYSNRLLPDDELNYQPFAFIKNQKPTIFQVIIQIDDSRYRYGFAFNQKEIVEEWLFFTNKNKERLLFQRVQDEIEPNIRLFSEAKDNLIEQTKDNSLFISVLAINNGLISGKIIQWFNNLNILQGDQDKKYHKLTKTLLQKDTHQKYIIELFKKSDLFIQDLIIEEGIIKTVHNIYDEKMNIIGTKKMDLLDTESNGTNKLFNLTGAIIDTLLFGKILFIDELDSSMHTMLSHAIISLFHNKNINTRNAQLIFSTHDTNFLNQNTFRRDQIWFIEKTYTESSKLYSLLDYSPRNDASLEKRYLSGAFGGIPYLKDFSNIVNE